MSKQIEALKLALEAFEEISALYMSLPKKGCMALAAIEEVLAQPEYSATSDHRLMENARGDLERITLVQTGVGIGQPERPAVPVEDDPCPGCRKGRVCRTPKCGRLKLPVDHPYRSATPAVQVEPVAVIRSVVHAGEGGVRVSWLRGFPQIGDRLYTIPQPAVPERKPWVGLTDMEREWLRSEADEADTGYTQLIKATEAKLKEKNT